MAVDFQTQKLNDKLIFVAHCCSDWPTALPLPGVLPTPTPCGAATHGPRICIVPTHVYNLPRNLILPIPGPYLHIAAPTHLHILPTHYLRQLTVCEAKVIDRYLLPRLPDMHTANLQ